MGVVLAFQEAHGVRASAPAVVALGDTGPFRLGITELAWRWRILCVPKAEAAGRDLLQRSFILGLLCAFRTPEPGPQGCADWKPVLGWSWEAAQFFRVVK